MSSRLAIALCFAAAPALADDCRWGGPPYSTANVAPDGQGGAVVTFHNRMTSGRWAVEGPCMVPFGGGEIVLEWEHGPGMLPDTGFVTPPEGFIAIPPHVVIEEDETGTVRIVPFDGVMG